MQEELTNTVQYGCNFWSFNSITQRSTMRKYNIFAYINEYSWSQRKIHADK